MSAIGRCRPSELAIVLVLVTAAACAGSSSQGTGPTSAVRPPDDTTGATSAPAVPTTAPTTTVPPTTVPPATVAPTTVAPTTVAPTTSAPDPASGRPAEELAGARVLCSYTGTEVPADLLTRIREGRAAGVVLFSRNLPDRDTARRTAAAIQDAAAGSPDPAPAMVAVDQEGGAVRRVPGPPEASARALGVAGPATVRSEAGRAAALLRDWGIDVDLAPVADVVRPRGFETASGRSFGGDPAGVADDVVAFVRGLHDGGVAATLKHFPGLGAAATNTDDAPSRVDVAADDLRAVDLVPFAAGVKAGADLVMVASAEYPALDTVPAVVSRTIVHDVLRGELGFAGVVVSDAFDVGAAAALGPLEQVTVEAANAGVDLFVSSSATSCARIQAALRSAIEDGRITRADAGAAYTRVITLRRRLTPG